MLKNPKELNVQLLNYLKSQLVQLKKDGVVIHLDGTLMSLVNISLAQQLEVPFRYKVVTCIFHQNKYALSHLLTLIKRLNVVVDIKDLSQDLDTLSIFKNAQGSIQAEIGIKKRFVDLAINIEADKNNLFPLSNQSYSQWCVEFPHNNYQALDQIHLLNRLYYSELQDFAKYLELPDSVVYREPSHYLYNKQIDKESLGFTYGELEDFLRNAESDRNSTDTTIRAKLVPDNRGSFLNPTIQRPSNILG